MAKASDKPCSAALAAAILSAAEPCIPEPFEAAAWSLPVGKPSGIVKSQYGYHIILVEAKQAAGTKPFEEVRSQIHEQLLSERMAEVMTSLGRLTNELRTNSKIAVYPENIK